MEAFDIRSDSPDDAGASPPCDSARGLSLRESRLEVGGREWTILHRGFPLTQAAEAQFINDLNDETIFGVALWPAAIALARAIATRAHTLPGARVLELGAGTGLPGITAASFGATVVQTDYHEPALDTCRQNGELNGINSIEYRLVDWCEWHDETQYDWIIGSDILYNIEMHPHLQRIFESNLAPGGRVLLSDPFRNMGLDLLHTLELASWTTRVTRCTLDDGDASRAVAIIELAPPA